MKRLALASLLGALTIPTLSAAAILEIKLFGSVTTVDTELLSEFAVGEAVEITVSIDTENTVEMFGASETLDGTRFRGVFNGTGWDNNIKIGPDFEIGGTAALEPILFDRYALVSPPAQRFTVGTNAFDVPDVNGLAFQEIQVQIDLPPGTFSGADDPLNLIPASEVLALDGLTFGSVQESIFSYEGAPTPKLTFDFTSISVTDLTAPVIPLVYVQQVGLQDIDGNLSPEIATLRITSDGRTKVVIRDVSTKSSIKTISFFSSDWEPISLSVIPDVNGNGSQELAVLARRDDTGAIRTIIKDTLTKEVVNAMSFAK